LHIRSPKYFSIGSFDVLGVKKPRGGPDALEKRIVHFERVGERRRVELLNQKRVVF
jgi:hypothetical protein